PFLLPNGLLAMEGVTRYAKWRALDELERLGLVAGEKSPKRSPKITLHARKKLHPRRKQGVGPWSLIFGKKLHRRSYDPSLFCVSHISRDPRLGMAGTPRQQNGHDQRRNSPVR